MLGVARLLGRLFHQRAGVPGETRAPDGPFGYVCPMTAAPDIQILVQTLVHEPDLAKVSAAAVALSAPGNTSKASAFAEYQIALDRFLALANDASRGRDRLDALMLLARLRKQQNRPFSAAFEQRLARPMPTLEAFPWEVSDSKERLYLAQAMRLVRFPEQIDYLAAFVASEAQPKSDARDAAAECLVEQAETLDAAFDALGQALTRQPHGTKDPGTSRAIRLNRTLGSVREALRSLDPKVGPETGAHYSRLLRVGLGSSLAERGPRIEVANAALGVLDAWVRPNFSLARRAGTFAAVKVLNNLFKPARWPDETRDRRLALAGIVREATRMLAEAGITDGDLRAVLVELLEEPMALAILSGIARDTGGLQHDVRHWLETGRALRVIENAGVVGETVLGALDRDLAEAFRDAAVTVKGFRLSGDDLKDSLAAISPSLKAVFEELETRAMRLGRRIESIGAQRGFELDGEVGAAVEYMPGDHTSDEPVAGQRVVRVVASRVVRRHANGVQQTVLKAKVKPI